MTRTLRRAAFVILGLSLTLAAADLAPACPFCSSQGTTLTTDAGQANLILYGTLANARLDPTGQTEGSTDLTIETVVKSHEFLGDKKQITLPKYIPPVDKDKPARYVVFCDVFKGKLDPYRGIPVDPGSRLVPYLQGAIAVKDKDVGTRLRFFFDYLDDADPTVTDDAYKEFGNADYKDLRAVAEKLPAAKVAAWLRDPSTPASRLGLYGSILGHCGKAEDAALLRKLLDDPQRRFSSGVDGMLAGYVLLQPKEGWEYIRAILGDPQREFLQRYAGLRAARFLWEFRPDVVARKEVEQGVAQMIDQKDVADLAIEDLRKWGCWTLTDRVLDLFGRESHDVPIVRRAILRFALTCPAEKNSRAAEFVTRMRAKDPKWVEDVEELLKAESPLPTGTPAAKK
jgi:hypothetical protein